MRGASAAKNSARKATKIGDLVITGPPHTWRVETLLRQYYFHWNLQRCILAYMFFNENNP